MRSRLPAPTIRLRLALLYGLVFLVSGAVLLTIGYELVRHNLPPGNRIAFQSVLHKAGIQTPSAIFGQATGGSSSGTPNFRASPGFKLVAAVRQQLRGDELHRLLVEYALALVAMTIASVAAGWLLAGRALRPLREITATARRVSGQNLGERIALKGPADELRELADTFDGMLARLDGAFASQRHFVANASHELRTPLAIMRTEVDVALADKQAGVGELREMGEAVRETIDRCEGLIESLLTLARSEGAVGHAQRVDLAVLAGDCVTDLRARGRAAEVEVHTELAPALAQGEPGLLERMVANLIDNAIRHNVRGGEVDVATGSREGSVWLTVANGGPLIDPGDARTLVEPFRRLDRGSGGFGLGLSIVRSVAEAHGGNAEVIAREEGGLEVRVTLPAAAHPPDVALTQSFPALIRN